MNGSEHIAARLRIYRKRGEVLSFGLGQEYGQVLSVAWGRSIGKGPRGVAGQLVAVLPDRAEGQVGTAWSEVISPRDYVELDVYCYRSPAGNPLGWGNTSGWETRFAGFIDSVSLPTLDDKGEQLTTLRAYDQMGSLERHHYSYWRNVGALFKGGAQNAGVVDTLGALAERGYDQTSLTANSIAGAAETVFKVMLYSRLHYSREIDGLKMRWDDLHAYRFESDDFGINVDLQALAPEGSTWADAVAWALDAPFFYEFYMDNVSEYDTGRTLANGGVRDVGRVTQIKAKQSKRLLAGGRREIFILRPSPFPTYDPERGGYNGAAWDSLKVIESLPVGNRQHELTRGGPDLYSVYSVDLVNGPSAQADSATNGNAEAQVVGDAEAYYNTIGYVPLDVSCKRFETPYVAGAPQAPVARHELSRRLAWQVMSWNHFNDRFYRGGISGALDLRAELGTRYLDEGLLFYVEGYQHAIDAAGGSSTDWTVSRGLSAAAYDIESAVYPHNLYGRTGQTAQIEAERGLYAAYLGRQRPGDEYAPVAGNATEGLALGVHEP